MPRGRPTKKSSKKSRVETSPESEVQQNQSSPPPPPIEPERSPSPVKPFQLEESQPSSPISIHEEDFVYAPIQSFPNPQPSSPKKAASPMPSSIRCEEVLIPEDSNKENLVNPNDPIAEALLELSNPVFCCLCNGQVINDPQPVDCKNCNKKIHYSCYMASGDSCKVLEPTAPTTAVVVEEKKDDVIIIPPPKPQPKARVALADEDIVLKPKRAIKKPAAERRVGTLSERNESVISLVKKGASMKTLKKNMTMAAARDTAIDPTTSVGGHVQGLWKKGVELGRIKGYKVKETNRYQLKEMTEYLQVHAPKPLKKDIVRVQKDVENFLSQAILENKLFQYSESEDTAGDGSSSEAVNLKF